MTPSKVTRDAQPTYDRRHSSNQGGAAPGAERGRRASDAAAPAAAPKRRTTRDGRQPLVVYLLRESIKALKIAALERDTTASAIVADAVGTWLRTHAKRKATQL